MLNLPVPVNLVASFSKIRYNNPLMLSLSKGLVSG